MDWISILTATALLLLMAVGSGGCRYDRESRMAEIRALQAEGQFDASIAPLRVFLTTDSSHPEANYRLGTALVQTGRPSLAIWPLQKAMQDAEYEIRAGLMLSATLLATESFEEAIRVSDQVLALEPERVAALSTRARANIGAGRPADALVDADHLLELRPEDPMAYALRVGALIDLERFDEAEQVHLELKALTEGGDSEDKAARSCVGLGVFYSGRGRHDEAEAAYDECLEKYPMNSLVQQMATDYFVEANKPDKAIEIWRKAVEAVPEDINLRAKLADLLLQQGRSEEAEAALKETVELFDTRPAWQMLGNFYRKAGRHTESREALEKALERARQEPPALRFALAEAFINEGNYERAEEIAASLEEPSYRKLLRGAILLAQDRPEAALAQFEGGIRLWPNNAGARYLAGRAAQQLGNLKRALAEYREAIRVDEKATDAALAMARIQFSLGKYASAQQFAERQIRMRPFLNSDAHIIAARSAMEQKLYKKAQNLLEHLNTRPQYRVTVVVEHAELLRRRDGPEAAVEMIDQVALDLTDPANAAVLISLAQLLIEMDQTEAALEKVAPALAAHPEEPAFLNVQARLLARLGRDDQARAALEAALAANAEYAPALEVLGTYAEQAGDREIALAYFDRAADADPLNPDYAYRAAQTALLMKRVDDAVKRLRKVVGVHPGHVGACNDLAWLLAEKGEELDLALEYAQRAVQLGSGPVTLDTLGWVYFKSGNLEAAAKTLEQALELYPESPSLRYRLALTQIEQGDTEAAIANLNQALSEEFPEAEAARTVLARLQGS
jgi:tetratricopeptide (TPR) repeat protein